MKLRFTTGNLPSSTNRNRIIRSVALLPKCNYSIRQSKTYLSRRELRMAPTNITRKWGLIILRMHLFLQPRVRRFLLLSKSYDMIRYMIWYVTWCVVTWRDVTWYDIWYTWWYIIWYMTWRDVTWQDTIWYTIWYVTWCVVTWRDVKWHDMIYMMIYYMIYDMICEVARRDITWYGIRYTWWYIIWYMTWRDVT